MHEIDLKKYQVRTDLILDSIVHQNLPNLEKKERLHGKIRTTEVYLDAKSAKTLDKMEGTYLTISFIDITDSSRQEQLGEVLVEELTHLLELSGIKATDKCFVVGLGNRESTPDALGPKVIDDILVTKYLFDFDPSQVSKEYRNVSAFIPGVMGSTGIESSDVILGIIERTKPDFLIVIDALAASNIDRCNKTIQLTDTGIHPGSGVGNSRKEISEATIGIPVIAIGVPTIVDAVTIVSDTIQFMLKQFSYNKENLRNHRHKLIPSIHRNYLNHQTNLTAKEKEQLLGMVGMLEEDQMKSLIFEVLTPIGYNLMVTPKEVDFVIEKLSKVISRSINQCLHPKLRKELEQRKSDKT